MKVSFPRKRSVTRRAASRVKVVAKKSGVTNPARRLALFRIAGQSVSLPAAYLLLNGSAERKLAADVRAAPRQGAPGGGAGTEATRLASPARTGASSPIIRDFADPVIELVRLLREASEIEHALMVQYLYAAFSFKPAYSDIAGYGDPNTSDLLGVAIQEMQHLAKVNRLLVALGAAPNLLRQDFPYEPDIYPFAFNLEPISRASLAKYVYAEAPATALEPSVAKSAKDLAFIEQLTKELPSDVKPNHVGSFYATIIATAREVIVTNTPVPTDLRPWIEALEEIKREGEEGHFGFFKRLFTGTHESFAGRRDIWDLPRDDPAYPALSLPENPSAYVGHENQIQDHAALSLAWLGNLHYWSILLLLNFAYHADRPKLIDPARAHMMGPFWSLARHLPTLGCGMPFDPLSMGYYPGRNGHTNLRFIERILAEAQRLELEIKDQLPEDFPGSVCSETRKKLDGILDSYQR
jgi:rubrerythrin